MNKTISFKDAEKKITVEAYEYEDDCFAECPQGEHYYQRFKENEIKNAFRYFLKLDEQGLKPEMMFKSAKKDGLQMCIRINDVLSMWSYLNGEEMTEVNLDKIARIKEIINE